MAKWKGGGVSVRDANKTSDVQAPSRRLKHIGGKPPRTASERPRTPGEARGEADWILTNSNLHSPTAFPWWVVCEAGEAPTSRTLTAEKTALEVKQMLLRSCICNILLYFILFHLSAFTPVLHVFGPE